MAWKIVLCKNCTAQAQLGTGTVLYSILNNSEAWPRRSAFSQVKICTLISLRRGTLIPKRAEDSDHENSSATLGPNLSNAGARTVHLSRSSWLCVKLPAEKVPVHLLNETIHP